MSLEFCIELLGSECVICLHIANCTHIQNLFFHPLLPSHPKLRGPTNWSFLGPLFSARENMVLWSVLSRRHRWEPAGEVQQERSEWEEVALSGAAQGLHSCSRLRKPQITEGWAEKTESKASPKSKGKLLYLWQLLLWSSPVLELLQKIVAHLHFSWKSRGPLSLFCATSHSRGSSVSPSLFPNQPSLFTASSSCYQMYSHKTDDPFLHRDTVWIPPHWHSIYV